MIPSLIVVGAVLYLVYWILGGALLASVSYFRNMHIHKARFGCLFTLSAFLCAVAASYSGFLLGRREIDACLVNSETLVDRISAVIGCGVFAFGLMAIAWFFLLGGMGMFCLLVSRSWNQSWMDSDTEEDQKLEFSLGKR